jgi:sugar lactone lactonase YvrE
MKYLIILLLLSGTLQAQTKRITFSSPMLYPEGTAYDSVAQRFFVSSAKKATIGAVDTAGNYIVFYDEPALKSSFGMKVDHKRNFLWVCVGDPNYSINTDSSTYRKMIKLVALDLSTGNKTKEIDLSNLYEGKHFANDLTIDDAGNIYITDSYSPVIYKVDTDYKATLFAQSNYFQSIDIGLNGIAWHPDGYLIVVNNAQGALYKVDTKSPSTISKIKIDQFFGGGDGLLFDNQKNLVLVQNKSVDKLFRLQSQDGWRTAKVSMATGGTDRFQNPSTCTIRKGKIYALNAKLNEIMDKSIKPSEEFSLQVAEFKPVQ